MAKMFLFSRRATGVALLVLWSSACSDVTPAGPSLAAVQVSNIATAATAGNPGVCCCRVTGTARNTNAVAVHATLKFEARSDPSSQDPLTTTLYFIKDFQPGATHAIDAPGLIVPCAVVRNIRTEVEVRGLSFPPF